MVCSLSCVMVFDLKLITQSTANSMQRLRAFLLLVSAVTFGLGISLPLMRFDKLYFFSETPSLLDIITDLWSSNEVFLSIVVACFSILFPLAKLMTGFEIVLTKKSKSGLAAYFAKWSMLDVLLVAIVIFAAKTSGLASAVSQPGVWFFAISTLTISIATALKK